MMAQHVPHQAKEKRRVKVYELRNNDWFDRGTGFCSAAFTPVCPLQASQSHRKERQNYGSLLQRALDITFIPPLAAHFCPPRAVLRERY